MQVEASVIYCAVFREREAIIRFILDHSRDDSDRIDRVHQILFHAACLSKSSAIEIALQLGVTVSTKNANDQTTLFVAVEYERFDAVEMLLKADSITTERDASSKSLLQIVMNTHQIIEKRLRCIMSYECNCKEIPKLLTDPCSILKPINSSVWLMATLNT